MKSIRVELNHKACLIRSDASPIYTKSSWIFFSFIKTFRLSFGILLRISPTMGDIAYSPLDQSLREN